jgi:23S rRNA (guanosine2251-2'-O)-methyltransferase
MIDLLYGRRPVYEVLRAGRRRVYRIVLIKGIHDTGGIIHEIVSLARAIDVPVAHSSRQELDRMARNHQGIVAETSTYPYFASSDILNFVAEQDEPPLFLLLDLLQDPQNLGSLLRTAEAVGVHGVFIPHRRAVGVTPAVVSTSAGAIEHLRIAQVTNLARTIEELKQHDVWVAGLDSTAEAQVYDRADLRGPLALVVGSEGSGLRRLVREKCDFLVQLPMYGCVASLNAAVAGSVALYEVDRQRRLDRKS